MAKKKHKKPRKLAVPSFTGDHGPKTAAQMAGTKIVPISDKDNPNNTGQKRRENVLERMHLGRGADEAASLSLRQYQAGNAIQEAFCKCDALSSGNSDYSKPIVDSSPKPDQFTAMHCDAQSRLSFTMAKVPQDMRAVVEHVCWYNQPISGMCHHPRDIGMHRANLKVALDLVANHIGC